ncbi:hypothetical protein FZEAL_9411 [Fusarium zealandicum]|uniref:Uncharacterized protein n=1 Tax=Fusarium zealandicum TaxID=1053134 RepID=A0A8H4UAZ0_9HYPO|nr:hypothetical protein FZEAL_9411 [Fusarium zealandicum]
MPTDTESQTPGNLETLQTSHQDIFRRALANLLSTDLAEYAYAQILDGLPTEESLLEGYVYMGGHPVFELNHTKLCEGFLDKARDFRARFDPCQLRFDDHAQINQLLQAFQNTAPGSSDFNLRLIELVVVAVHQIAAYLYDLDDGAHKHQVFGDWLQQELAASVLRSQPWINSHGEWIPPATFFHSAYVHPEQYPRGLADVAGYWAEGKIFGGVILFDRGESEQEVWEHVHGQLSSILANALQCKAMWIHGARLRGPTTLYPPTSEQFDSLVGFLLSGPDDNVPCPLPIHGTRENRPRWDPWHALAQYHIFRDKYERYVSPEPPKRSLSHMAPGDWPEMGDEWIIDSQDYIRSQGHNLTEEDIAAAYARLKEITPSSPLWRRWQHGH